MQLAGIDDEGLVGIEADHVGRRALFQPALFQPQNLGGAGRHRGQQAGQGHIARMHEAQPRRQHRLKADGAELGLREGQALGLDILRIVVGDDHIDEPFGQRLHQQLAVVLARAAAGAV